MASVRTAFTNDTVILLACRVALCELFSTAGIYRAVVIVVLMPVTQVLLTLIGCTVNSEALLIHSYAENLPAIAIALRPGTHTIHRHHCWCWSDHRRWLCCWQCRSRCRGRWLCACAFTFLALQSHLACIYTLLPSDAMNLKAVHTTLGGLFAAIGIHRTSTFASTAEVILAIIEDTVCSVAPQVRLDAIHLPTVCTAL